MVTKSSSSSTTEAATAEKSASEGLSDLKHSVSEGAQHVAGEAKRIAGEVAGQVRDAAGQIRSDAESTVNAGKGRAADGLGGLAQALRHTSEQLGTDDKLGITPLVGRAANQVESLSNYIQTRSVAQMIDDAQEFGRREPALLLGGAFVLGLLGGRFVKAASPRPKPTPALTPRYRGDFGEDTSASRYERSFPEPRYEGSFGGPQVDRSYGEPYRERGGYAAERSDRGLGPSRTATREGRPGQPYSPSRTHAAVGSTFSPPPSTPRRADESGQAKPGAEYASSDRSASTAERSPVDAGQRRAEQTASGAGKLGTSTQSLPDVGVPGVGSGGIANGGSKQLGGQASAPKSSGTAE